MLTLFHAPRSRSTRAGSRKPFARLDRGTEMPLGLTMEEAI